MGKKRIVRRYLCSDGTVARSSQTIKSWTSASGADIERERAGRGWRHVLNRAAVERFIELIDDWDELAEALSVIRLAAGSWQFGYGNAHVIAVRAFPKDLRVPIWRFDCFARRVLSLLDVPSSDGCFEFEDRTARAWQLLDVFTHELGHHVDARSCKSLRPERGEGFALKFSADRLEVLWARYRRAFEI